MLLDTRHLESGGFYVVDGSPVDVGSYHAGGNRVEKVHEGPDKGLFSSDVLQQKELPARPQNSPQLSRRPATGSGTEQNTKVATTVPKLPSLKAKVCAYNRANVTCPPKTSPDPMLLLSERIEDTGPKKGGRSLPDVDLRR
jgi:hypothetical protein